MESIKLRRPLTKEQIFNQVLDIIIEALEELDKGQLKDWKNIFQYYGTNVEYILKEKNRIIEFFREWKEETSPLKSGKFISVNIKWWNTIKYTLYLMEEEILLDTEENLGLLELWEILYGQEDNRAQVHTNLKPILRNVIIKLRDESN